MDDGFLVIDRGYRIRSANKAFCSMNGVQEGQVIGSLRHTIYRPVCVSNPIFCKEAAMGTTQFVDAVKKTGMFWTMVNQLPPDPVPET